MITVQYPRHIAPAEVLTQRAFDLATAQLMSWRQAPGAFGGLHLHACWGESSSIARRYHGQTVSDAWPLLRGFIALHERTNEPRWRLLAEDIVANVLYLQTPDGGFRHASGEFEPTYTSTQSCPIHQGLPLLALITYAAWEHTDHQRAAAIRGAVDAHLRWFLGYWWQRGNRWSGHLGFPAFCGVANQDLVIVAALAMYCTVFGDDALYRAHGLPVLETYLSSRYYHHAVGLFERGDKPNFAERTAYYDVIVPMLAIIQRHRPDPRLPDVIDNVAAHIFHALHIGGDGMLHVAWGAETDADDKSAVTGWIQTPHTFNAYPGLLAIMAAYLQRHPDRRRQAQYDDLERTLAAYVFADGTIPLALGGDDPLFRTVSRAVNLWSYLIDRLGADLRAPSADGVPCVHRSSGDVTFRIDSHAWSIERNGRRCFAGWKCNPSAIAVGLDDTIPNSDLSVLKTPDILEHI